MKETNARAERSSMCDKGFAQLLSPQLRVGLATDAFPVGLIQRPGSAGPKSGPDKFPRSFPGRGSEDKIGPADSHRKVASPI